MLKFIAILTLIFAAFYFGGAILFDTGIAGQSGVSRVPAAVQAEQIYKGINRSAMSVIKIVDFYIAPVREGVLRQTSSVLKI